MSRANSVSPVTPLSFTLTEYIWWQEWVSLWLVLCLPVQSNQAKLYSWVLTRLVLSNQFKWGQSTTRESRLNKHFQARLCASQSSLYWRRSSSRELHSAREWFLLTKTQCQHRSLTSKLKLWFCITQQRLSQITRLWFTVVWLGKQRR